MDPLSDVLTLLRPRRLKTGAANVAGDLSIRMPSYEGLFCYAVLRGGCWLTLEGGNGPTRLLTGDCVILPSGGPFRIATNPDLPPIDAGSFFADRVNGGIATYNGGGDCLIYAAHFDFGNREAEMLLSVLPPIVHIREEDDRATMRWSLDRMMAELREPRPWWRSGGRTPRPSGARASAKASPWRRRSGTRWLALRFGKSQDGRRSVSFASCARAQLDR